MLVEGGELHERWSSLVGVSAPLSAGIQRFGISQAMVGGTAAGVGDTRLARRLRGRVLIAHSARFDLTVLRQAFARAALDWPDPPVLCTIALARRLAPLQRRRGLKSLADALGIDVATTHRALPDAETCARVFCALFKRLCAHAATGGRRGRAPRPAPQPRAAAAACRRPPPAGPAARPVGAAARPEASTSSATRTGARSTSASPCACARARGRTSPTPATWTGRAERRLPGDGVRARCAAARGPPDQGAAPARQRARQARPRRVRLPALPARHRVPDPRGRAGRPAGALSQSARCAAGWWRRSSSSS